MEIDETALNGLIEQSRDTHADALRAAKEPLADMVDLGRQSRAGSGPDPDESRAFAAENRRRLAAVAKRAGGLLAATGLVGAIADYIGSPAFAASGTDVQVLQTASGIEVLAISTYKTALGLPYIGGSSANPGIHALPTTCARPSPPPHGRAAPRHPAPRPPAPHRPRRPQAAQARPGLRARGRQG